jgi:hypothetical protein
MSLLRDLAPIGTQVTDYDRRHLALYAALLDAEDAGLDWSQAASSLLGLDPMGSGTEACWRSHMERARWMVGAGLPNALEAFARQAD